MFEPIDRKAAIIAAEQLQMIEDALAIVRRELLLLARDDVPILLRPVDHRAEFGVIVRHLVHGGLSLRSEEHTSELQSLMRISYAVFCLKKKKKQTKQQLYIISR